MYRLIRAAACAAAVVMAAPASAATLYTFTADGVGTTYSLSPANPTVLTRASNFYRAIFSFVLGNDGRFLVPGNDGGSFVSGNIAFRATDDRLNIAITNGFQPRDQSGATSVSVCGAFGSAFPTTIGAVAITPGCGSASFSISSYNNATDFSGQVTQLTISTIPDGRSPFIFAQGVPEPATWALMLTGFAMTGYALRRRRARVALA